MKGPILLHRGCLWWSLPATSIRLCLSAFNKQLCQDAAATALDEEGSSTMIKNRGEWFTLPPFSPTINASILGKELSINRSERNDKTSTATTTATTALKWVLQCCPQLPRSLIQKLFRLRQVRREMPSESTSALATQAPPCQLKRVAAKDLMILGDQIFLPITVKEKPSKKQELLCNEEEIGFIRSLVLYKDPAIIIVNKPPGMPVQGGSGIKRSLDELASTCLTYEYKEPPRLVHRLDRDSSGILVMGRTQKCATLLHSVFREKTFGASKDDFCTDRKILQRKYWALVIGSPRLPEGLISAPLGKVVVDSGKSERITIMDTDRSVSSQHAITEYRVISSCHGYVWLELSPLTGRKHQLRVHCAEALGTPIVGDYKYGRLAHKKLKHLPWHDFEDNSNEMSPKGSIVPFGLREESNSKKQQPHLHLHCKEMVLPNVDLVLQNLRSVSDDLSELESLHFVAPLPSHMQKSWEFLHS